MYIYQSSTPGPGTYGKGGVPHAVLEEKSKKSPGTVGMLDAASSTPRNLPAVVGTLCFKYKKTCLKKKEAYWILGFNEMN